MVVIRWSRASVFDMPMRALLLDMMSTDPDFKMRLLTIAEVAELLRVSVPSVRRLQQQRLLPFIKVRGSIRFALSDLVAYLESKRVKSVD